MKTCVRCGESKPLGDFHRRARSHDGLNAACKTCICADRRSRRNPEREAAYTAEWRAKNPDYSARTARAWREANLEEYRKSNRERVRAYYRRFPERKAELGRRRRAARVGAEVGSVDLNALWTGECGLCFGPMDAQIKWPDPWSKSVDHIVPIVLGGRHEQSNLQWTHLVCNMRKGASMPEGLTVNGN